MSLIDTVSARKWAKTLESIKRTAYWIVGGLIVFGISYYLYSVLNRPVAGALIFVGGAIILFYYWIKWFVIPPPPDQDFESGNQACPDYLSVVPADSGLYTPTSKTQYYCVDYVGVSRNGNLKKMAPEKLSQLINDPTYRFSIDPAVDLVSKNGRSEFMRRLIAAGLSYNSIGTGSLPSRGN
jgi:hypothetical protein